jgi:hypothetical protein
MIESLKREKASLLDMRGNFGNFVGSSHSVSALGESHRCE